MDIKLTVNSPYECVYLINGKFMEEGEITYGENQVVYITVMPLDAMLLHYTVKLVGALVRCNGNLCDCYKLGEGEYYLKLAPRFNYVYTPSPAEKERPAGVIEKFFSLVQSKKTESAREYLTSELSQSIDDAALVSFFDGFKDIIAFNPAKGHYHLIKQDNTAVPYNFIIKNTLIDNIVEA